MLGVCILLNLKHLSAVKFGGLVPNGQANSNNIVPYSVAIDIQCSSKFLIDA